MIPTQPQQKITFGTKKNPLAALATSHLDPRRLPALNKVAKAKKLGPEEVVNLVCSLVASRVYDVCGGASGEKICGNVITGYSVENDTREGHGNEIVTKIHFAKPEDAETFMTYFNGYLLQITGETSLLTFLNKKDSTGNEVIIPQSCMTAIADCHLTFTNPDAAIKAVLKLKKTISELDLNTGNVLENAGRIKQIEELLIVAINKSKYDYRTGLILANIIHRLSVIIKSFIESKEEENQDLITLFVNTKVDLGSAQLRPTISVTEIKDVYLKTHNRVQEMIKLPLDTISMRDLDRLKKEAEDEIINFTTLLSLINPLASLNKIDSEIPANVEIDLGLLNVFIKDINSRADAEFNLQKFSQPVAAATTTSSTTTSTATITADLRQLMSDLTIAVLKDTPIAKEGFLINLNFYLESMKTALEIQERSSEEKIVNSTLQVITYANDAITNLMKNYFDFYLSKYEENKKNKDSLTELSSSIKYQISLLKNFEKSNICVFCNDILRLTNLLGEVDVQIKNLTQDQAVTATRTAPPVTTSSTATTGSTTNERESRYNMPISVTVLNSGSTPTLFNSTDNKGDNNAANREESRYNMPISVTTVLNSGSAPTLFNSTDNKGDNNAANRGESRYNMPIPVTVLYNGSAPTLFNNRPSDNDANRGAAILPTDGATTQHPSNSKS